VLGPGEMVRLGNAMGIETLLDWANTKYWPALVAVRGPRGGPLDYNDRDSPSLRPVISPRTELPLPGASSCTGDE
jgi:hypothetical protein